jgi:hypothetical protein
MRTILPLKEDNLSVFPFGESKLISGAIVLTGFIDLGLF